MEFTDSLHMAEQNLTDGATLDELRALARDLRALTPNGTLTNHLNWPAPPQQRHSLLGQERKALHAGYSGH